jgi:hypothetical protein
MYFEALAGKAISKLTGAVGSKSLGITGSHCVRRRYNC